MSGPDGSRPTDILSVYQGNPAGGDSVTCADAGGCAVCIGELLFILGFNRASHGRKDRFDRKGHLSGLHFY